MKTAIVGVTGLAGSGKDTFARRLIENHGFVKESFARRLKELCAGIYGWEFEKLEVLDYKEERSLHAPITWTRSSVRAIAHEQFVSGVEYAAPVSLDDATFHLFKILSGVDPEWTRRRILQWVGTEGFRHLVPDHWVNRAIADGAASIARGARGIVFPDVRFPNEATAIQALDGVIVRVVREGQPSTSGGGHSSEGGVADVDRVVIAASGKIESLWEAADALAATL